MPKIKMNDITMNYDQQGSGEPLIMIPYLAADNALLCLPGCRVRQALYVYLCRSKGSWRD